MSSPESLLKATIKQIKIRIERKMIDLAKEISLFVENSPEKLNNEWEIFKQEVYDEAEIIENKPNENNKPSPYPSSDENRIDGIRKRISKINKIIEETND
tara:strand:- start:653 stop:952 length:300 start_codon:yes stop_codon:yes gene_type:complete